MRTVELLIGGVSRPSGDGRSFDRCNPVSGQIVSRAAAATLEDADDAVMAAAQALPAWAALGPAERRARLMRAADLLEMHASEFIECGATETGAASGWIGFNVSLGAGILREAAAMTTQIGGEVIPSNLPGNLAMAVRQPAGVVLGIAPWNAPIILAVRAVAMPLACGNTVVLKTSEICPAVHRLVGTVLQQAGLGDGVVNVVSNAPADAPALVERLIGNPRVRRVNFTGSTAVGRIVAMHAARHLKPALLELGGKAAMLVLEDADLDAAVEAAAFGAFFNQGRICMSTERLIVDERIADQFVEKLAAKASSLKAGDPSQAGFSLTALVSREAGEKLRELVEDAQAHGAIVVPMGAEKRGLEIDGSIAQPCIVDGVDSTMRLYAEESFGPLVAVIRVKDEDHAVRIANDTQYGLSAAIFSRDTSRALRLAAHIQSGICHINGPTVHDEPQMPFGGVRSSGYGRFGGKAAIAEFTELRWITIQTTPRHYPI